MNTFGSPHPIKLGQRLYGLEAHVNLPAGDNPDTIAHPPQEHTDLYGGVHPLYSSADTDPPASFDNIGVISRIGGIRNQGQAPTCVSFAFIQAIAAGVFGQGLGAYELSSSLAFLATLQETNRQLGLPPNTPLIVSGTQPTMAIAALARVGVGLETARPYSDQTAALIAPETIAQAGDASARIPLTVTAYASLSAPAGAGRILAMQQGISAFKGSMIVSAMSVDAAFENCDGSSVLLAPDLSTYSGGHMINLAGFAPVVSVSKNGSVSTATLEVFDVVSGLTKTVTIQDPTQSLNVDDVCARVLNQWSTEWAPLSDVPGTAWAGPAYINALAWMYLVSGTLGKVTS